MKIFLSMFTKIYAVLSNPAHVVGHIVTSASMASLLGKQGDFPSSCAAIQLTRSSSAYLRDLTSH